MLEVTATITGDRSTSAAFARYGRMVVDLEDPLEETVDAGERAAAAVTPVLSGALVRDYVVRATKTEATLTVGDRVDYAGVQNYGWPARGIEGKHFLEAAEEVIDRTAADAVSDELTRAARLAGLSVI